MYNNCFDYKKSLKNRYIILPVFLALFLSFVFFFLLFSPIFNEPKTAEAKTIETPVLRDTSVVTGSFTSSEITLNIPYISSFAKKSLINGTPAPTNKSVVIFTVSCSSSVVGSAVNYSLSVDFKTSIPTVFPFQYFYNVAVLSPSTEYKQMVDKTFSFSSSNWQGFFSSPSGLGNANYLNTFLMLAFVEPNFAPQSVSSISFATVAPSELPAQSMLPQSWAPNVQFLLLSFGSSNGAKLYIAFMTTSNQTIAYKYPYREYFLPDYIETVKNGSYAEGEEYGYNNGFTDGESQGRNDGYNLGYEEGSASGYNNGYNVGYENGVTAANEYSFFSLISAVVDAPIKAFMGLLDFNVFGYNMTNFYLSLLTACLIIAIIKMIL